MDSIEFTVAYTLEDFKGYSFAMSRKANRIVAILIFIFALIFPLVLMYRDDEYSLLTYGLVLVAEIIVVSIFGFLNYAFTVWRIKRIYKTNHLLPSEHHFVINNKDISTSSEQGNLNIQWNQAYKILKDKYGFYILISSIQGFIIPKRALTKEQENFMDGIISNIGTISSMGRK